MLDEVEKKVVPEEDEEEEEVKKLSKKDLEGFLNRNKVKEKVFLNISDMQVWKSKN